MDVLGQSTSTNQHACWPVSHEEVQGAKMGTFGSDVRCFKREKGNQKGLQYLRAQNSAGWVASGSAADFIFAPFAPMK